MKCHEARRQADLFMDGELSVQENLHVLEHVNLCRSCAAILEGEKALRESLREQWMKPAPPHLADRIRARLARGRSGWRWGVGIAAVLLAGFLASFLFLRPTSLDAREFAAAAVAVHEASRAGPPGPGVCLKDCCSRDIGKSLHGLCRDQVPYDICVHPMEALGYVYRSAGLREVKGKVYCWTQQVNASGGMISHTCLPGRLTREHLEVVERGGRAVVLVQAHDGFT